MSYLVDSDVVVDWLKGRTPALEFLAIIAPDGLAISIVTYAEIYEGIYHGRDTAQHEIAFRAFLHGVHVLGINRSVARTFARVRGELRAQWLLIPHPDLFIAATVLSHDLTLVTRNVRHFARSSGLRMIYEMNRA